MTAEQKKVFKILLLLGAIYFALFIIPNLAGAQDANMLAVFEVDEYAQYPHVIRMLTPGDTPYQTLRNFLIYLHYFYGYPFYFFSALALLPVKWLLGGDWAAQTPVLVMTLRQMLSVLPMLLSVYLLVFLQTRYQSLGRSALLFLFLLSLPALVTNNLWWHPDSLAIFFVALTFFLLDRDDLRYGRSYLLAAAACGLAISAKHVGAFFFLAIPVYLLWGLAQRKLTWLQVFWRGALFVAVMAAAILVSNPLLLLPMERAEIIATQRWNLQLLAGGFWFTNAEPYFPWGSYPEDFRIHYGELWFVLLGLASLLVGLLRPKTPLLNALLLAWVIPLTISLNFAATRRTHYFLPVMLPYFSSLLNLWPSSFVSLKERAGAAASSVPSLARLLAAKLNIILPWALGLLLAFQWALFLRADVDIYLRNLYRERDSASIAFYRQLEADYLPRIAEKKLVVYRDWRIYFPEWDDWQIEMSWNLPNSGSIAALDPDLILLERENLVLFSQPESIEQAVDPEAMRLVHQFYRTASLDQLEGYRLLLDHRFGSALLRHSLYDQYFAP